MYKFPLTIPYPIMPVGVVAGKAITEGAWEDKLGVSTEIAQV